MIMFKIVLCLICFIVWITMQCFIIRIIMTIVPDRTVKCEIIELLFALETVAFMCGVFLGLI